MKAGGTAARPRLAASERSAAMKTHPNIAAVVVAEGWAARLHRLAPEGFDPGASKLI